MDTFVQDLRHALRLLRSAPGFTFAAVTALALGIGANTAIFSVLNTVILKPLPYPDPERLVMFLNVSPQGSGGAASPTKFNVWRRQTGAFEDVSAYRFSVVNITGDANPEQVSAAYVSADFFRLFGAVPIFGRTFSQEEDRPGGGFTVVLGNGFWRRRFGGDPGVIGRTMLFNGQAHEIIGVLGPFDTTAIQSAVGAPEVWLPFQIDPNSTMQGNFFTAAGRLKPGVSVESGTAQLASAAAEFRQAFPQALPPQVGFGVQTLQEMIVRNVRSSLWILVGAVSFVLLIACANVANLLLVRATVRQREIAIRAAIGAARGRIARQLMTESLVLSLLGGLFGLALGVVGIRALLALNPGNIPRIGIDGAAVGVDGRVLAFTAFVSVLTGLVFGLFPALRAARVDLSTVMKESAGRSGTGFKQNKTRAVLVITEIALALILLVGAALLIRTYIALRAVDPGFDPQRVLTMRMSLTGERFAKTATIGQLMREGRERLEALPEVEAAAASCCVPLQGGFGLGFIIEGRPLEGPAHGGGSFTPISANYFNVFKIPVLRGRYFTEQDTTGAPGVVIINQAMARQVLARRESDWRTARDRARAGTKHGAAAGRDRRRRRRRARRCAEPRAESDHVHPVGAAARRTQRESPQHHVDRVGCPHARRALFALRSDSEAAPRGQRRTPRRAAALDGGCRHAIDRPRRFQHAALDDLCRISAHAGGHRRVRADGVFGAAAHAGDGRSSRARRRRLARQEHGRAAGHDAGGHWRRHRHRVGVRVGAGDGHVPVRRHATRSAGVRRRPARPGNFRLARRVAAGAARRASRSGGSTARRLARITN